MFGLDAAQRADLQAERLAVMRQALTSLRAAQGTRRIVVSEWDDDQIEAAAVDMERRLADEAGRSAVPPAVFERPAAFD